MEKGQLRCDANVSIRNPDGSLGTKTELKNMNSFRFVERGLARELERQRAILESGGGGGPTTAHYDTGEDEGHRPRRQGEAPRHRHIPPPDPSPLGITPARI